MKDFIVFKRKKPLFILVLLLFCSSLLPAAPCGDVNSNGMIDIVDALMVARYLVGLDPQPFDESAADVSGDGVINIIDALQIAQYCVGYIDVLSGCPMLTPPCTVSELQADEEIWNNAVVENFHSGYTGSGYVNTANVHGTWIEWSVDLSAPSSAIIKFRYACESEARSMNLCVNDGIPILLNFSATGAWTTWV